MLNRSLLFMARLAPNHEIDDARGRSPLKTHDEQSDDARLQLAYSPRDRFANAALHQNQSATATC